MILQTVILLYLAGMFITTRKLFYLGLIGLLLGVYILSYFASKYPEAKWVKIFFGYRWPRTDVKYMSKRDLLVSGSQFLASSFFILVLLAALGYLSNRFSYNLILWMGTFGLTILFLAFFINGLYLLIRGIVK